MPDRLKRENTIDDYIVEGSNSVEQVRSILTVLWMALSTEQGVDTNEQTALRHIITSAEEELHDAIKSLASASSLVREVLYGR